MADMSRLEHEFSRRRRILRSNLHLADALAPFAALYAQLFERAHPAFVARAPCLHALANPRFFLGQFLVEQRRVPGLDLERSLLLHDIVVITARPNTELPSIEFHDARRQAAHEGAIVADEQQRAAKVLHHLFEPGDGIDVQMIGRLVQQQQIRLGDQCAAQHHAPPPSAR
jgi:hypothetical protein